MPVTYESVNMDLGDYKRIERTIERGWQVESTFSFLESLVVK